MAFMMLLNKRLITSLEGLSCVAICIIGVYTVRCHMSFDHSALYKGSVTAFAVYLERIWDDNEHMMSIVKKVVLSGICFWKRRSNAFVIVG
jgi:hypothetical protein